MRIEVDANKRVLLKKGKIFKLHPKIFDLLLVLIKQRGEAVSKDHPLDAVWENH